MELHTQIIKKEGKKEFVVIPIKEFEKLEEVLENYGLAHLMEENEDNDFLSVNEAKVYYNKLKKPE